MPRLLRITASFALVVAAYALYAALVAPWVEPSIEVPASGDVSEEDLAAARNAVTVQRQELAAWFREGEWERTSSKILKTEKGIVLLEDYENRPNGEVAIIPCTLVFLPEDPALAPEDRRRRAIIVRAPEGAVLQFDKPLRLQSGSIGRLTGGRLQGPIDIRSDQRSPGPEDDLAISARDLVLNEATITSPHPLDFRLGPHSGRGVGLKIELTRVAAPPGARAAAPMFGGIDSFELVRDVLMEIHPADRDLFGGARRAMLDGDAANEHETDPQGADGAGPPLIVTCDGPFHFDLVKYLATFQDNVELVRAAPDRPKDELHCRMLQIEFEAATAAGAHTGAVANDDAVADGEAAEYAAAIDRRLDGKKPRGLPKLRPAKVAAWGNPVSLESPANGVSARGEYLEYDMRSQSGSLRDDAGADFFRNTPDKGRSQIHARQIDFSPGENDRLGRHAALGAGWLESDLPAEDPGGPMRRLTAHWSKRMQVRPDGEHDAISLEGDARVELGDDTEVKSQDLHLWLEKQPAAKKDAASATDPPADDPRETASRNDDAPLAPRLAHRLQRVLATGLVEIRSPQLTGLVGKAMLWFEYPDDGNAGELPDGNASESPDGDREVAGQDRPREDHVAPSQQQFRVGAQELSALIVVRGNRATVARLQLERKVRVEETRTARPDEQPLVMFGEKLDLVQPTPQDAIVTLIGSPARVEARGLTLIGGARRARSTINFDRRKNLLWTGGPGRLVVPLPERDESYQRNEPRTPSEPRMLDVSWNHKFEFDGRVASFFEGVTASVDSQSFETEELEATFNRKMSFGKGFGGQGKGEDDVDVERVFSPVEVYMTATRETPDGLQSVERMHASDFEAFPISGEVLAHGPGWVRRAFLSRADDAAGLLPARRRDAPANKGKRPAAGSAEGTSDANAAAPSLSYLGIEFDREMQGDMKRESADFYGRVRTVYGPIDEWSDELDPFKPERLGDRGFTMNCDKLSVQRSGTDSYGDPAYELTADGKTFVEGAQFTASAHRLTYATAKELLLLEGELNDNARITYQQSAGQKESHAKARRIWYWPRTRHVSFEDASGFDVGAMLRGAKRQ